MQQSRALAVVAALCSVLAVGASTAAAAEPQVLSSRQLLQDIDPFAQFNTPTPPGSSTTGQPQLVNLNVPAVATSNGVVSADAFNNPPPPPPPVLTPVVPALTATAPLPAAAAAGAAAGPVPQVPPAAAGPAATTAAAPGVTPGSDPFAQLAAIQQQLAAYTAALAAARGQTAGANQSAVAPAKAPAPAAAAKPAPAAAAAADAPAPAPKPVLPPGVVPLTAVDLNDTVQVNITALPALVLPPATTQTFSWVCTGNGTLYLVVGGTQLLKCPAGNTINLAKTFAIADAGDVKCPNNRLACPGNTAVSVTISLATLLADFAERNAAFVSAFAKAAGVAETYVVITDVKDLLAVADTAALPAAAAAAGASAGALPAATGTLPAAGGVLPAAAGALPASSGLSSDLASLGLGPATTGAALPTTGPIAASLVGARRLKQAAAAAAAGPPAPKAPAPAPAKAPAPAAAKAPAPAAAKAPAAAAAKAPAANATARAAAPAAAAAAPPAVPTLEVVVNVQPLTVAGAVGAARKLATPAFSSTLKTGLTAANITLVKVQAPVTGDLGLPFDLSAAGVTGAVAPSALPTAGTLAPPGVTAPGTNVSTTLARAQPMLGGLGVLGAQPSAAHAVSRGGCAAWLVATVCAAFVLVF